MFALLNITFGIALGGVAFYIFWRQREQDKASAYVMRNDGKAVPWRD